MKRQKVGLSDLESARLSYGCMRVAGTWTPADITTEMREKGKRAILAAYDAGYNLFDHADIYCRGECEAIHGEVLKDSPSLRQETQIATKCGIRFSGEPHADSPHRYDFSAEHILWSCEQSLKRLGVETIEIYQLHRPDLLMDPAEIAEAFTTLKEQGKVRYFGVSNFVPSFVSALQSALSFPLVVNQVEIHLGRLDCFVDGTLDQCIEKSITPLSWSPLGGGWLGAGGKVADDNPQVELRRKVQETLDEIAAKYEVSRTVIALAWLLKHPSGIIPIVGSTNPSHIKDAVQADAIDLDREDWYRILVAARGASLP
ncbi:MAG: aldo/keto reductase [Armatimonadetes bacterium 55-13]|nr:aldo/keto reductase [Armatimonadota bacterium]OJU64411.1 MAG: aldo/keto reductase [Armatimonadetes bacterium 55-13]